MRKVFCFKEECAKIIINNEKICARIDDMLYESFEYKKLFLQSLNFCLYNYICFNYDNTPDDVCKLNINNINLRFTNDNFYNFKKICDDICENYAAYYAKYINYSFNICSQAKIFVNSNLDKQITLDDISLNFHINKTYFCRLFKKDTGICFIKYINLCKIKKAKELLVNTSFSIEEISEKCGFSSLMYFNKVFNSIESTSPSCYRKKIKNINQ